jgi:two-component system response regulator RegA
MSGKTLFLIEDDEAFARTLARSFARRDYDVFIARSRSALEELLKVKAPDFAVVDLKLGEGSGLPCIPLLASANSAARIVVLTGYASISTAVEAIKLGATHYLPKPCNTDEIEAAFGKDSGNVAEPIRKQAGSIKTWEWERINQTLAETNFNISETARRLGMHRRTLVRKLRKNPPVR